MRLAAFRAVDDPVDTRRVGLVLGEGSHLVAAPVRRRHRPRRAARRRAGSGARTRADVAARSDGLRPTDVVLLPPVYPIAMRDFLTFEAHVDGMERGHGNPGVPEDWFAAPVFLFMAPHAVTGAHDDVAMPPDTERLDFELEIAAIVCRDVRNVSVEEAGAAIGGYCVMNDWSARDVQGREMKLKLGPSKGKDFATTIGPWVVTADELDAYRDAGRLPRPGDERLGQRRPRSAPTGPATWAGPSSSSSRTRPAPRGSRPARSSPPAPARPARSPSRGAAPAGSTPPPLAGRRRRRDDHREHRHDPQPGRRRPRDGAARPGRAPRVAEGV